MLPFIGGGELGEEIELASFVAAGADFHQNGREERGIRGTGAAGQGDNDAYVRMGKMEEKWRRREALQGRHSGRARGGRRSGEEDDGLIGRLVLEVGERRERVVVGWAWLGWARKRKKIG